jgi:alkanesulfonate monooxygenase SsuD/methylene tetrahydromethanopterin reductase-like flavin-dependent oxidoreductase (luciferase family)
VGRERALLDSTPGARALRLGQPPVPDLPIWLGAMGDRTTRVAAELADGWFPYLIARDHFAEQTRVLGKPRETAGLRVAPLTVASGPLTVASDDAAVARDISASCIAWYLCAMGDVYAGSVARQGYATAVQAILDANPRPRPDAGIVPTEAQVVLDQLAACGTAAQVRDRLAEWEDAVDLTMIGLPPGLPWPTIEATLRAAAP